MSLPRHSPPPLLIPALLVVLPALVLLAALDNGFHLDDWYRVRGNPAVEQLHPLGRHFLDPGTSASLPRLHQYRPLLPLTLSLNYALAGHDVRGYHAGNLLVHVLSVLLLYRLVRELAATTGPGSPWLAGAVALLWGVHPVSGVPVNYICARDLLLMQLFLLASLLVYVRMRRRGESAAGWSAALLLMALSLLSKTNAVALPLVVLAFELCLGTRRALAWATWKRVLPFAAVAAGFFAWTRWGLHFSDLESLRNERTPHEYALAQLAVHVEYYLRNVFWPFQMRALPEFPPVSGATDPRVLLGLAVVSGSLLLAWRVRRTAPVASFAILAYWLLFTPDSSVLPFRYLAADYRPYPSLGFLFLAVGVFVDRWVRAPGAHGTRHAPGAQPLRRGRLAAAASLAVLLAGWFGWASHRQNAVWQDEVSLWSQSVRYGTAATGHMNLGRALMGTDGAAARPHLQRALELEPGFVLAWINLGLLDISAGRIEDGLAHVKRGVDLQPDWSDAWRWYGLALQRAGRFEEAFQASRRALELDPEMPERLYYAALHAQLAGRFAESLELADRLEALRPGYENVRFIRAHDLYRLGRLQEAVDEYRRYLAQAPDDAQAARNLALALEQLEG